MTVDEAQELCKDNLTIFDSFEKAKSVLSKYERPMCSISGGKDSDIMLDIIYTADTEHKVKYVWFNTGIEYSATKEHLRCLEDKYNIKVETIKAIKPIPISCKQYGQPFLSKQVSEFMMRLQAHEFQWEDLSYDELMEKYSNCSSALKWWCNLWQSPRTCVSYNKYLKEFLIANPPRFKISNKCCVYAKKDVAKHYLKENKVDLNIMGVRKAEGGARATSYKSCFTEHDDGTAMYRPLFWYENDDEAQYDRIFGIEHSACYTEYGLKRTGCVGCPYNRSIDDELEVLRKYEPQLYKAANYIFKDSYEYTRQYHEFAKEMKAKEKS